ncbi:YxiG family protein [Streptococcus ruminantium]|uniref:YxiG family protein n=1 Tax=Streptococcus ruminantium TaxID=1917441 RepID=UPI0012DCD63D|nr:hypothetical protein [Streptococcus ruminantium]MDQ8765938.1 hypothetical protein [Streptococcus ruminantium]MDQ8820157.1 hypothetical protein [Streptococcus ruminantium]MDQ8837934.1 hypothetical protein [Streptococcus ruminantium]
MTLQEYFEEVIESRINSYRWDMLNNTLFISLILLENGVTSEYQLEFRNVSCLYFANDTSKNRTIVVSPDEGDYLELTSIHLLTDETDINLYSETDKWLCQFNGKGNIVLEIWNKLLVIECSQVLVDGKIYNL